MIQSAPVSATRLRVVFLHVFTALLLALALFLAPVCRAQTFTTSTSGTVIIKSDQSAGVYVLTVSMDEKKETVKIVRE